MCSQPSVATASDTMSDSYLSAVSVLLPPAVPASVEVASAPEWRAISQDPGGTPVDMAIEAGACAVEFCGIDPRRIEWLIHTGSGYQGARSWPVHHAVQAAVLGPGGNAFEVRQFCAGGLTSWTLATSMRRPDHAVACTAADNWSWTDRFALSRNDSGEPFADVASAAVVGPSGFAQILGTGTASCPDHAEAWQSHHRFWEHMTEGDFRGTYVSALGSRDRPTMLATTRMIAEAIRLALTDAAVKPAAVTYFVPPSSRSGEPYRMLAHRMGIPWMDTMYQFHLDHGYLSVSAQAGAFIELAKLDLLSDDVTVLLVATEYNLSATALVVRIVRRPRITYSQRVTTIS